MQRKLAKRQSAIGLHCHRKFTLQICLSYLNQFHRLFAAYASLIFFVAVTSFGVNATTPATATVNASITAAAAAIATAPATASAAEMRCGISAERIEHLRAINKDVVARGFAPGIVTQLYCDGKNLFTDVQGLADVARSKPLAVDHLFRIYSMTKPLTSLAVMMLAEDGTLSLDDPVARFIPEFDAVAVYVSGDTPETMKTAKPRRAPTIRDLLRHSAGLTYRSQSSTVNKLYVLRGIDSGAGPVVLPEDKSPLIVSLEEFGRRIASIPLLYQPGEKFSYGNATDVLGRVVELASGKSFRKFLDERIFKPLKMDDTAFEIPAEKIDRLTAVYWAKSSANGDTRILRTANTALLGKGNLFQAEDPRNSIFAKPRALDFGGAGLVSTAPDYQRFMQMMLAGGVANGRQIVSANSIAEMTRNQLSASALTSADLAAQGLGFGLGFSRFVDLTKAPAPVSPNFYFWGGAASTYFWVDPDRNISGVVMTQVFGGDMTPFYVDMLNAIYGGDPAKNTTLNKD